MKPEKEQRKGEIKNEKRKEKQKEKTAKAENENENENENLVTKRKPLKNIL